MEICGPGNWLLRSARPASSTPWLCVNGSQPQLGALQPPPISHLPSVPALSRALCDDQHLENHRKLGPRA
ncbi:hypothetical protein PsYK624_100910 [Phanerochaete sordida]|uniref:Uncharacterized protein n=1 Tax=Phanerochaete sordida TaxID=48140 RepID=A0A9P3LFV7_9APHY|nr:hypothetical protein PsYK624_100910 [Phanerochaete sordida]